MKVRVCDLAALGAEGKTVVELEGEGVALFRRGDEVLAIGNECPHQAGSLGDGWLEGDIVVCPLHGWEFDLRSGACMTVPGERVPRWVATVEGDAVYLEAAE